MNYPESEKILKLRQFIQTERSENREHSVPIYMTSSFNFEDAEQPELFCG